MSKNPNPPPVVPLIILVTAVLAACIVAALVSDLRVLACLTAVVIGVGVACRSLFPIPGEADAEKPATDSVSRSIAESRNEVINAMSILQQEIRLLQSTDDGATEKKTLRDEVSQMAAEVAALKRMVQLRK